MESSSSSGPAKRRLKSAARSVSPPPGIDAPTAATSDGRKKIKSTTTKNAVLNFFAAPGTKAAIEGNNPGTTWQVVDGTLLVGRYRRPGKDEETSRNKIAGFDLDGTLISTQSGAKFAKSPADWKWWHSSVPGTLRELYGSGYQVVIFTNQGGVRAPKMASKNLATFKLKVETVLGELDVPLTLYAATEKDKYRKPRVGMWEQMLDDCPIGVGAVDLAQSYLVGDAAGRQGDFSDSDRHWAMNVGIGFQTPEEFFLRQPGKPMSHRFDPSSYLDKASTGAADSAAAAAAVFEAPGVQELVVFVGSPGAGKSTFYRKNLAPLGYVRVNQDELKTRDRCIRTARDLLSQGKSVAVDNTNADVATRALWTALAAEKAVRVRCLYFTAAAQLCQHNNAVRGFGGRLVNPENRPSLPGVAFTMYASRFSKPAQSEGFDQVVEVDFQWQGDDQERAIWSKYWI